MILVALCVTLTTSVVLTGEYASMIWFAGGPIKFTLLVEGVSVYKPNDFTTAINASNTFPTTTIIQTVIMDYNNMKYMPANYTRLVPNTQYLVVRNSRVKYITNWDFSGLTRLIHTDFRNNEIESLPGNLFLDSGLLETVSFANNKIFNIAPTFILNIKALKSLNLTSNACINSASPPSTLASMIPTINSFCQKPVSTVPDVISGPPPTFEEYNALKAANDASKKTIDNLTAELMLRNDKIKELQASLDKANTASKMCFDEKTKLTTDLKAANDDNVQKAALLDTTMTTNKMQSEKIVELTNSLTALQAELDKCKVSSTKLQADLTNEQNKLQAMKLTNDMNKQTIDEMTKNIDTLKSDLMKRDTELATANMKLVDAQNALAAKEILNMQQLTTINDQMKKIADLEKVLSTSQSKLGNAQTAYNTLFNQLHF